MITILVTDRHLVPAGDPLSGWTSLDVTANFNAAGSGTLVAPATPDVLTQVNSDGARLVVIRDGAVFLAGPVEKPGPFDWSADGREQGEPGVITLSFTDDLARIAEMLTYPDPTAASTAQTVTAWTATAANGEVVMRDLVNTNCGPGALSARQIEQLALGTLSGVGGNVTITTRFEPLTDVLRTVALAAGGLGFRTTQQNGQILFDVYAPTDLTGRVRFSRGLGNLREVHYNPQAPTVTAAIVGGDGTGSSRTVRERIDSTAVGRWWRMEQFVNRGDTSSTTEMDQAGDAALAQGAEQAQLAVVAIDLGDQRYGVDYGLGDRVSVEIYPGTEVADVVRAVNLTASPDGGEVVSPLIGSASTTTDSATVTALRDIERRLGRTERN